MIFYDKKLFPIHCQYYKYVFVTETEEYGICMPEIFILRAARTHLELVQSNAQLVRKDV